MRESCYEKETTNYCWCDFGGAFVMHPACAETYPA